MEIVLRGIVTTRSLRNGSHRRNGLKRRTELGTMLAAAKAEASASTGPEESSYLATLLALATGSKPEVIAR